MIELLWKKIKSFIEDIDKNQKWRDKFSDEEECTKISKQHPYLHLLPCQ